MYSFSPHLLFERKKVLPGRKFFLFCLLIDLVTSYQDNCPISRCGEISIQYPFSINSKNNNNQSREFSKGCVYPPGFGLSCRNENQTILKLPSYGEFYVQGISYNTQEIQLSDPGGCLPRRYLQNVDSSLSRTPFVSSQYQSDSYIFYNCSTEGYFNLTRKYAEKSTLIFYAIDCLSSLTHVVLATESWGSTNILHSMKKSKCEVIDTHVFALAPWHWPSDDDFYPLTLKVLSLKWFIPEAQKHPRRDVSKGIIYGLVIVGAAVAVLIGIIWCCCSYEGQNHQTLNELSTTGQLPQQPSPPRSGLEESTIQSYPQIILCESRKFLNPENTVCSICLADYKPKDTLKSLPVCNHYFHVNCIDGWLRMNGSCLFAGNPLFKIKASHFNC
ncbi:hypothetical protein MKX03_031460 [Papaver bracteatum]|nr:hypothetical protein MKX03_031460 [Papaver bracteatum]